MGVNTHRRGDQRREGRHRGHLRAVPHPDRLPRSDAARAAWPRRARTSTSGSTAPGRIRDCGEPDDSTLCAADARSARWRPTCRRACSTNADLEKMVDTTDEWILQRTGISERHIVDPGVATSDLGKEAALKAIAQAGLTPADIDLIIVGHHDARHVLPEHGVPSSSTRSARPTCWGFDLARRLLRLHLLAGGGQPAGGHRRARPRARRRRRRRCRASSTTQDRATCVLFGDGAGAVRRRAGRSRTASRSSTSSTRSTAAADRRCSMPAGGSLHPAVARDGREAAALRQAGRPGRVQVRRAQDRGDLPPRARAQRLHARRRRPVRVAPGEPPHHHVGGRPARAARVAR